MSPEHQRQKRNLRRIRTLKPYRRKLWTGTVYSTFWESRSTVWQRNLLRVTPIYDRIAFTAAGKVTLQQTVSAAIALILNLSPAAMSLKVLHTVQYKEGNAGQQQYHGFQHRAQHEWRYTIHSRLTCRPSYLGQLDESSLSLRVDG